MKKLISVPNEPRLEVHPDAVREVEEHEEEHDEIQPVPNARYGNINLKKYNSFKETRCLIKLSNQELLASQQLNIWLGSVDKNLNMFNLDLIIDVCNFCESFFIYGSKEQRECSIEKIVVKCLLPFCKNDTDIVKALMLSVAHRVKKSTKMSRNKTKLFNFFFIMGRFCLKNSVSR